MQVVTDRHHLAYASGRLSLATSGGKCGKSLFFLLKGIFFPFLFPFLFPFPRLLHPGLWTLMFSLRPETFDKIHMLLVRSFAVVVCCASLCFLFNDDFYSYYCFTKKNEFLSSLQRYFSVFKPMCLLPAAAALSFTSWNVSRDCCLYSQFHQTRNDATCPHLELFAMKCRWVCEVRTKHTWDRTKGIRFLEIKSNI